MRDFVVAGNWKMHPASLEPAIDLGRAVAQAAAVSPGVTTIICPPALWLLAVRDAVASSTPGRRDG